MNVTTKTTTPATLADAKRLIAAASAEAARLLGPGVSHPTSQDRYTRAARAALADPAAQLTPDERRLIASFIPHADGPAARRETTLQVRLTPDEHAALQERAAAAGLKVSEYVRRVALGA